MMMPVILMKAIALHTWVLTQRAVLCWQQEELQVISDARSELSPCWLCRHAAKLGITLVTITQRAALLKYHSVELRLVDGEGDWQLRAIVPEDL